jgi:hypothetical protein
MVSSHVTNILPATSIAAMFAGAASRPSDSTSRLRLLASF